MSGCCKWRGVHECFRLSVLGHWKPLWPCVRTATLVNIFDHNNRLTSTRTNISNNYKNYKYNIKYRVLFFSFYFILMLCPDFGYCLLPRSSPITFLSLLLFYTLKRQGSFLYNMRWFFCATFRPQLVLGCPEKVVTVTGLWLRTIFVKRMSIGGIQGNNYIFICVY